MAARGGPVGAAGLQRALEQLALQLFEHALELLGQQRIELVLLVERLAEFGQRAQGALQLGERIGQL
ncbi:MAG: hypothetical protein D6776_01955, partial [Planctomycetota bacterium]